MRRAVVLAALVLVGCGDELERFRAELRPLEGRAEEQRSTISGRLSSLRLGSEKDARSLRAQTAQLSNAYDEIEELDPPDDYLEPFGAYVRANRQVVENLDRFAAELARGDVAGLRMASRRVVRDLSRSQAARLHWLE